MFTFGYISHRLVFLCLVKLTINKTINCLFHWQLCEVKNLPDTHVNTYQSKNLTVFTISMFTIERIQLANRLPVMFLKGSWVWRYSIATAKSKGGFDGVISGQSTS